MPDTPGRRSFYNNHMPLDGLDLSNADAQHNVFTYEGGALPNLHNANFGNNTIYFTGPAANTLAFARMMLQSASIEERILMLRAWGFLSEAETIVSASGNDDAEDSENA